MNFKSCFFSIVLIVIANSCSSQKRIIKGDLTFRSITFTSAYGVDQSEYSRFMKEVRNTIDNYEDKDENIDKKSSIYQNYLLSKRILKLHQLNLLKLPHIYLHFGSDSIMEVYVSEKEYNKIKHFNQKDLLKEKKKVLLELVILEKDKGIFYSDKLINIKKVDGESRSNL